MRKKGNEGQNKVSDEESEEQRQRVTKGIKHKGSKEIKIFYKYIFFN